MKRSTKIIIALAAIIVLAQSGVLSALMIFWIGGIIPGTNYAISPVISLALTIVLVIVAIYYGPIEKFIKKHLPAAKSSWSRNLPRLRYSRIQASTSQR